jgi:hypothetical protein
MLREAARCLRATQGTENPRVGSSILPLATNRIKHLAQLQPLGFLLPGAHAGTVQAFGGNVSIVARALQMPESGPNQISTQSVHWGLEGRRMQRRASLGLTEKAKAGAMGDEESPQWPSLRRMHPNSTAGAPDGQFGFKSEWPVRHSPRRSLNPHPVRSEDADGTSRTRPTGSQKERDASVSTSARAIAHRRHGARGRAQRTDGARPFGHLACAGRGAGMVAARA